MGLSMSFDEQINANIFITQVAAIFEENCLHKIQKATDIEKGIDVAVDYCLDQVKQ